MAFTSTLLNKIKHITQEQKKSIRERLISKGEFPWFFQIIIAIGFWFILFILLLIIWNPIMKWIIVVIAVVGAYLSVETANYIGRKITKNSDFEEEICDDEIVDESLSGLILTDKNSILLSDLYESGGVILISKDKGKLNVTPLIVQIISSISSTTSIFSFLSSISLQKISLKFHCSVVDSSRYEVLILKGNSYNCRVKSLSSCIRKIKEDFFHEALELRSELQREKRLEFEKPSTNIIKELFPSYSKIIRNSSRSSARIRLSTEHSVPEMEEEVSSENEELSPQKTRKKISAKIDSEKALKDSQKTEQQKMIKEVLLKELDFSFDAFLNTVKNYYKKAVEININETYEIDVDTFLKTVSLYCDKNDLAFFYPSYSYFLKIIEFLEIELPSSTEIENFVTRVAEEFTTVIIPDDYIIELSEFLDHKLKNNRKSNEKVEEEMTSDLDPIPLPPSKNITSNGDE